MRAEAREVVEVEHRQERRGRPGMDTPYRRVKHHCFGLSVSVDAAAVTYNEPSDGCFPFVTKE